MWREASINTHANVAMMAVCLEPSGKLLGDFVHFFQATGAYSECSGGLGSNPPPFCDIFLNFLRFFKKKIPKPT